MYMTLRYLCKSQSYNKSFGIWCDKNRPIFTLNFILICMHLKETVKIVWRQSEYLSYKSVDTITIQRIKNSNLKHLLNVNIYKGF